VGVFVSCSFCFLSQAIIWAFYWFLMAALRVLLTPDRAAPRACHWHLAVWQVAVAVAGDLSRIYLQ
jgi:hypothetical protein